MTTATGTFAVNFAALSDVNPYTNANLTEIGTGRGKILSAVYRWASGAASRTAQVYNGTVSGNLAAKIEFETAAGSGDAIAAIICDTSGNGYAAVCNSATSLSLIRISALTQADVLGSGNPAASAGDVIELRLNQTSHLLEVYKNGSTLSISATDSTVTANLKPGFMAIADNTGNATIKSFALDGSAAAAVISGPTPSGTLATSTTATVGGTTDTASGTAYTSLDQTQTNVTTATDADIKAGHIVGGSAAQAAANASVSSTTISIPVTGLGAGVLYYYSEIQNSTGGDSNRISGSFTTLAVTNYTENQTATATVSSATTGTITFANTPVSGELLVVTIAQNSGTATVTPPAGWTQKATINPTSRRLSVFYKVAGGSESGSYAFTFSVAVSAGMCGRRVSAQAGYGWSGTQNGVDVSTSSDSAVSSVSTSGGSANVGNLYVAVGYSANTSASNKELLPNYSWSSNNLLYSSRSRHAIRPTSGVNQIFGYNLTDAATDTRNAFLMSEFLQVATSPAISSIDDSTPNYLGSLVITGNASALPFPTSQSGSAGVTLGGVSQSVTWNTTTSCSITNIARGTAKYGATIYLVLTDASGNASPNYATTLSPQTGWAYVDTTGTLATAGDRITAVADIVSGDQIVYGNVQGGTIADVTVYADGSFSYSAGVTAFDVCINDGIGFGTVATQTISYGQTAGGFVWLKNNLTSSLVRPLTSGVTG